MYIQMPDPNPGRCLNFRHDTGPYGKARRCLEAEGTKHVCRFDPPERRPASERIYQASAPEPWIVP